MGETFIGACSWNERTLVESGRFYPPGVRTGEGRLRFYASRFPIVEMDEAFHALLLPRATELWARCAPAGFLFHVSAFGLLSGFRMPAHTLPQGLRDALPGQLRAKGQVYLHELPQTVQMEVWQRFRESLQPLQEAGKLGLVLFQFAGSLMPGPDSQAYVLSCQAQLAQIRIGVEFRSGLWLEEACRETTLRFLREHGLSLVCVDEPQGLKSSAPPVAEATADQAYVRFHGRNREGWETKDGAPRERSDYSYSTDELEEWVPRLRALQDKVEATHVIMAAGHQDRGIAGARRLKALLWGGPEGASPATANGDPAGHGIT